MCFDHLLAGHMKENTNVYTDLLEKISQYLTYVLYIAKANSLAIKILKITDI